MISPRVKAIVDEYGVRDLCHAAMNRFLAHSVEEESGRLKHWDLAVLQIYCID